MLALICHCSRQKQGFAFFCWLCNQLVGLLQENRMGQGKINCLQVSGSQCPSLLLSTSWTLDIYPLFLTPLPFALAPGSLLYFLILSLSLFFGKWHMIFPLSALEVASAGSPLKNSSASQCELGSVALSSQLLASGSTLSR